MSAASIKYIEKNRGRISLSALLIVSLMVLTGLFFVTHNNTVNAAAITSAKDTINNSAPGATSTHEITFTTPTGVAADATMTITFPSSFTTGTLDFTDIDLTDDGVDVAFADVASAALWGATTTGVTSGYTLTNGSAAVAGGSVIVIQIGDNATASATGDAHFTNPGKTAAVGTADIYTITIAGGFGDSGDMLIAVIEAVTVSVTIDETLTFTIAPVDLGDCNTTFGSEAGATTTTSTVPFGTITSANTFNHACHNLSVSTNASSGYVVTTETDTSLQSGGVLIDSGSCTGSSCTEITEGAWGTNTDNGFAYTCDGTDCVITVNTNYKTFACTGVTTTECLPSGGETAQNFMSNTGSVNNSTTSIEYRISLSGTQEAGTYTSVVTYINTPTF